MDEYTLNRIYLAYRHSRRVTTDSRQITPGCIFFAFRGEHFDGNAFAPQALEQGAVLCVVSDKRYATDDRCILVPDVLEALQELARLHRSYLTIPVLGITGTNGKTTTKELVHSVLARRFRTAATAGNYNNHLGVPLTLLAIPAEAQIAVVEMGASHPGEIAQLCSIADPDCGLITNVGRAHLEGFGSFEGVVRTKTELYRHLAKKHGLAFVHADDKQLMAAAESLATMPTAESMLPAYAPGTPDLTPEAIADTPLDLCTYGSSAEAEVRGTLKRSESPYLRFYFEVGDQVYTVQTHLLGDYNFANCMAAVAVGLHFGVEPFDIKEAIEGYVPRNHRSEFRQTARGNRLYLDCYNANPSSMEAAIASFAAMAAGSPTLAVVGGMKELGEASLAEHRTVVEKLAQRRFDRVLLVGPEFEGINLGPGMQLCADTKKAAEAIARIAPAGCAVLIKGSNSNHLWELEELF